VLAIGCVAEGYGMMHWGKKVGHYAARRQFDLHQTVQFEACHFASGLITVLLCALLLRQLADTFHRRQTFSLTLLVTVFGLGPVMLARIADAFPAINPWLSWGMGAVLITALLYQGLPRVLNLDPSHALGVYLSASVVFVLISGLNRLFMVMLVQPRLLDLTAGSLRPAGL
jgi:hypothetical protein